MATPNHLRRRWQFAAAATFLIAYLAAFAFVHSRALHRSQEWNTDCLFLTSVSNQATWRAHRRLATLFAPVYWIRFLFTGRSGPCVYEPLFELSEASDKVWGVDVATK